MKDLNFLSEILVFIFQEVQLKGQLLISFRATLKPRSLLKLMLKGWEKIILEGIGRTYK